MESLFDVPNEILVNMFQFLDADDLINIRAVCKLWHGIVLDHSLIMRSFRMGDWEAHLHGISTRLDIISKYFDDIPINNMRFIIDQLSKHDLESGIDFYTNNIGNIKKGDIARLCVAHRMDIPEKYLELYPQELELFLDFYKDNLGDETCDNIQSEDNICGKTIQYFNLVDILRIHGHNEERMRHLFNIWFRNKRGSITKEEVELIYRRGFLYDLVQICHEMEKEYIINDFIEFVTIDEFKCILQMTRISYFPIIRVPNEELFRICGGRTHYESIYQMMKLNRFDLINIIISFDFSRIISFDFIGVPDPSYTDYLFLEYIYHNQINEAKKHYQLYQCKDVCYIYDKIIQYRDLDTLLMFYDIIGMKISNNHLFPSKLNCLIINGGTCNFNTNDKIRFYELGGKLLIYINDTYQQITPEMDVSQKILGMINIWFAIKFFKKIPIDYITANSIKSEIFEADKFKILVDRFGLETAKLKMVEIDILNKVLKIGDLKSALELIQAGIPYTSPHPFEINITFRRGESINYYKKILQQLIDLIGIDRMPALLQNKHTNHPVISIFHKLNKWYQTRLVKE